MLITYLITDGTSPVQSLCITEECFNSFCVTTPRREKWNVTFKSLVPVSDSLFDWKTSWAYLDVKTGHHTKCLTDFQCSTWQAISIHTGHFAEVVTGKYSTGNPLSDILTGHSSLTDPCRTIYLAVCPPFKKSGRNCFHSKRTLNSIGWHFDEQYATDICCKCKQRSSICHQPCCRDMNLVVPACWLLNIITIHCLIHMRHTPISKYWWQRLISSNILKIQHQHIISELKLLSVTDRLSVATKLTICWLKYSHWFDVCYD